MLGLIDKNSLGVTLTHEHIFINLSNQFKESTDPEKKRLGEQKISLANYGMLRRNPYAIKENLLLDNLDLAVEEIKRFQELGGETIVDCTSAGINRSPERLRAVAERSGLNIIAGSGYYTADTHPAEMDEWSAEKVANDIICDLTSGIDGTVIKAGVIGEIGTSDPIHPNEVKCLLASAIAFGKTNAAIQVHTYPWGRRGLEAVDLLVDHRVNPAKIVICHADVELDIDYMEALLEKGVFVEFDNFGKEYYIDSADRVFAGGVFARDIERVRTVKELLNRGYQRQILIANDICLKSMLHAYGGWGYDHILCNILPMMLDEGITQEEIDLLLRANPQCLLC